MRGKILFLGEFHEASTCYVVILQIGYNVNSTILCFLESILRIYSMFNPLSRICKVYSTYVLIIAWSLIGILL